MLKIRLQRTGRNHETTFRIVLTDSQNSPKSGRYLEVLGNYDPRKTNENIHVDRIKHWLSKGVQVSDTIHNLFVEKKIITAKKVNALPKRTPLKKETPPEAAPASTPAPEAKPEPAPVA